MLYSKRMYIQNRAKAVNSLFPTHGMLLPYEDTFISFPNRKSNKTILIIKDVAITVPKAISIVLSFLFLWTDPVETHRSLVAWVGPETSKGAMQSKLCYDFTGYGSSNQPLWERSHARKYLFGNTKVRGGKVYLQTIWLPETWLETVHHYGFFKVFPKILCNHKHTHTPFFIFFFLLFHLQAIYSCKSGGWAYVIPTPGFQNEKAVCYLMFLWLWPKQQSLTDVSSEITGYRVTKKMWFRVDLLRSISDVAIRLCGQRTSGRSWETVKK